jgi:hypothetical protein
MTREDDGFQKPFIHSMNKIKVSLARDFTLHGYKDSAEEEGVVCG